MGDPRTDRLHVDLAAGARLTAARDLFRNRYVRRYLNLAMLSLKKLLGRDDKFFDLLEAGAEEAKAAVALFSRYLEAIASGTGPATLDEFIQTRRKEKRIRHRMT